MREAASALPRQSPVNRFQPLRFQKRIRLGKMPASEKAVMRRQGRGMRGLQHEVPPALLNAFDKGRLFLRVAAPEQDHDRLFFLRHQPDDRIGECLPAAAPVGGGHAGFHGQHAVEEEHALLGPMLQMAMVGARNVGDVLNNMPSTIAPVGFGQSRVAAIRGYYGFESARGTAVRFDGVPMNKLRESGGLMAIDGFDLNTLSSVELIRGPGSSLHGNHAFHGVLSLESLTMTDNQAQVILEAGSFEDTAVAARGHYNFGQHSLTVAAAQRDTGDMEQAYSYVLDDPQQVFTGTRSNARESANALVKYKGAISPNLNAHATLYYLDFDAEQLPGIGSSPGFGSQQDKDWTEFEDETLLFKLGLDYQFDASNHLGVVAYQWRYDDHFLGDYRNVPALGVMNASFRAEVHNGFQIHQRHVISESSNVSFGYEYQSQELEDYYSLFTPAGIDVPSNRVDYDEQVGFKRELHSVVVDGKQALGADGLVLLYGLRIDDYSDKDLKTQASPRLGATYWVNAKSALHFTYSEAFRAPGLIEKFSGFLFVANPELQPEKITNIEAKWSLQQTHWFHRVTLFTNYWDDGIQIETDNQNPSGQYENAGENKAYGIEFESQGRWQNYQLNVSSSFIRSKNTETEEHFSAYPHWNILAGLGYEKGSWGYYWNNHFMRRSAVSSGGSHDVGENYFRSDIVVKWQLFNTLQLSIALKNIFDKDNSLPSYTGHPDGLQDEHRNGLATLQYQF